MRYITFKHPDYPRYRIVDEDKDFYYINSNTHICGPERISKKVCNIKHIRYE